MGVHNQKSRNKLQSTEKIEYISKMAFYIYEQPAFSMKHFHPGFLKPLRSVSRTRHWNLMDNLLDQDETACQSTQRCCSSKSSKKSAENSSNSSIKEDKMAVEVNKCNEENKVLDPVTKTVSKRFMTKVTYQETMNNVQVINDNVLVVKAEDDVEIFEKKFKLPSNILVEKIESKFAVKEEDTQTLLINIPKDVKVVQVPIAMDE